MHGKGYVLVKKGEPSATIVTSRKASEVERLAAEELQNYLAKISGVIVPIREDEVEILGNRILIGRKKVTEQLKSSVNLKDVGREGFVIKTLGRDLIIVGGGEYGTLYGVYTFLEKYLGVRWFLPGPLGEVVPKLEEVKVGEIDDREEPDFAMRWVGSDQWALRNRANGPCDGHPTGFNIQPSIYHSQHILFPVQKYFSQHPEYFALVNGKRSDAQHAKLCTSNPKVVKDVAKNMAKLLDENPTIDLISLSPTDGWLYCECENCRALDEPGASTDQRMSRRMLLFYNQVAEELEKSHPDKRILVGAYHIYARPPMDKSIKGHKNLSVIICHYNEYCLAHPVNDPNCKANECYRSLISDWQTITPHIYFYEYYWKANWLGLPWPIVHTIAEDIPYFKSIGVEGLYTQYALENVWTLGLDYYVAAKLLWNCRTDVKALLEDFYEKFFGAAAPAMKKYYTLMEKAMAESATCISGYAPKNASLIFTPRLLAELRKQLRNAEKLAEDEKVTARIEKIKLSLDFTERVMDYFRLRESAMASKDKADEARALAALEALQDYMTKKKERFKGVIDVERQLARLRRWFGAAENPADAKK